MGSIRNEIEKRRSSMDIGNNNINSINAANEEKDDVSIILYNNRGGLNRNLTESGNFSSNPIINNPLINNGSNNQANIAPNSQRSIGS